MKKKFGAVLMTVGILLLSLALGLFLYNIWDSNRAGEVSQEILSELEEEIPKADESDDTSQPLYELEPELPMPTVEIDGNSYIGRIEIPSLDISLPVLSEWSEANLKIAPCRYKGSAYLDNLIIAAHNYDSHFGRIHNLRSGDSVVFTDMDGSEFYYTVVEIEQLQGTAVEQMEAGDWALSLFTCTIGGEFRVTVRCEKAE